MLCFRWSYRPRPGFTIVELMIAVTIGCLVSLAAVSIFVFCARMSRFSTDTNLLDNYCRGDIENLKNDVRMGKQVRVMTTAEDGCKTDGDGLEITCENGSKTSYYLDASASGSAPANSRLMCRVGDQQPREILRYVDQERSTPLFVSDGLNLPVTIHLHLAIPGRAGMTGPVAADVLTTVAVRNR